jgi:hypothetical protein
VARGSGLGSSAAKEAVAEEPTALAWLVLGAANRAQAKGSNVRLIVPRAPEVAQELGMDLTDEQFLSVEKYLEDQGYIAPADVSLTWSAYTITSAGYEWLGAALSDQEVALATALWAEFSEAVRQESAAVRERDDLRPELETSRGEPRDSPSATAEEPERVELGSGTRGTQERAARPWWRRVFGD